MKVLLLDQEEVRKEPEEEAVRDGAAERKAAEARELIGKVKERMRPTREAVEKARGAQPGARDLLEYVILRIKWVQ